MKLNDREKKLLILLGVVVLGVGLYFVGGRGLFGSASSDEQIERMENVLKELGVLAEQQQQQQKFQEQISRISLTAQLENIADRFGIRQRIQLNPIGNSSVAGLQEVEMQVDDISIDEMVYIVHAIESDANLLVINTMEVIQSLHNAELLRLVLRVEALL